MYVIIEMQTDKNGNTAVLPPQTAETRNQAESTYHQILTYAAVSNVYKHVCCLMDDTGEQILAQCYKHEEETTTT